MSKGVKYSVKREMALQSIQSVFIFILLFMYAVPSVILGFVDVPGDIKIVGLFKVHELLDGECKGDVDVTSVMTVEAVKWYIKQLNEKGGVPLKIGFEAYETCGKVEIAVDQAVRLMNRAMNEGNIIGVIGPEYSSEAEAIAPVLSTVLKENKMPQVGFSTTATRLTDSNRFPNFVGVVPNDDIQVDMMIQSMVKLEWSRIAIVYEDNIYGQDMEYALQMKAKQVGICVALSRKLSVSYGVNLVEVSDITNEILYGTNQISPISGIVFVGSKSSAKEFILYLTKQRISTIPIVMFSEGSNLEKGIFTANDGSILTKALGNLLLSPAYTNVHEFSSYWNSIFTNASVFQAENRTSHWLSDVYYNLNDCDQKDCIYKAMSNEKVNKIFSQQSPYIKFAMTAAHVLVKGVVLLHQHQCTEKGLCSGQHSKFKSGDVLQIIRGMTINLATDFSWRPGSLQSLGTVTISNITGDSMTSPGATSYQLFNVQRNADIVFTNIGNLSDKAMTLSFESIRDYDEQGRELLWPSVRKAQCLVGRKCTECIPLDDLQEAFLFEPGDIYVVGVVPVFQKDGVQSCGEIRNNDGYMLAEAIRFLVQRVSKRTGDLGHLFPAAKVGVIILNSCMSSEVIQRKILNLNKVGIRLANGTLIDLSNKIIGYIAEYSSTVSKSIADILTPLKFVQVSYASTSPALSDRSNYPYFMRVVTPDDKQAKAMVDIMERLDVQYAQIVYSAGAYGEGGKDKVRVAAQDRSICIAQDISVSDGDNVNAIYEKLKKYPHAKVVIAFLYSDVLMKLVSALSGQMKRGEFLFIGSEAWARLPEVLEIDTKQHMLGSFTLSLEMYQDRELRQHIRNNTNRLPFQENPWSSLFIEERNKCFYDTSFDKTKPGKCSEVKDFRTDLQFALDTFDTSAFVATSSLLIGANAHLQKNCGKDTKDLCEAFFNDAVGLVEEIKKVKLDLDGTGTKMRVFDNNGDGNIGYRIYNIQKDPDNPQSLMYREIGRSPLEGTFTFERDKIVVPTDDGFVSKCPNKQACSQCFKEGNNSAINENTGGSDGTTVIALGVLLAVFCLSTLILAIKMSWNFMKKRLEDKDVYLRPNRSVENNANKPEACDSNVYHDISKASTRQADRYV